MPVFKRVEAKNQRVMYYKDGDMISPNDVPRDMKEILDGGVGEIDTTPSEVRQMLDRPPEEKPELKKPKKLAVRECIVCGEKATKEKFLHLQMVYLCTDDYLHRTTGEVAAAMREKGLI